MPLHVLSAGEADGCGAQCRGSVGCTPGDQRGYEVRTDLSWVPKRECFNLQQGDAAIAQGCG